MKKPRCTCTNETHPKWHARECEITRVEVDRRTLCLLCAGRCDPDRYTCRRCHDRLMRLAAERLIDDALREQVERERAEAAQEAPCTS